MHTNFCSENLKGDSDYKVTHKWGNNIKIDLEFRGWEVSWPELMLQLAVTL
jgi:hypothetical protein